MASKLAVAFLVVAFLALASSRSAPRIIGGDEAAPHEFPYQLSLQWNFDHPDTVCVHFCGASLLTADYALTAGHCDVEYSVEGFPELVAAEHNVEAQEGPEQRRRVAAFVVHPGYGGGVGPNDIGVIRVERPFELNEVVQPVQLPKQLVQFQGDVTLTGWGSMSTSLYPEYPDKLRKVVLPLVDFNTCHQLWDFTTALEESNVCAGPTDGSRSACSGDSGGPLVKQLDDAAVQVGVVSWGSLPCGQPNRPTVFTGVAYFVDWIEEQLRQDA
ncbi:trypsin-1-like [Culex pipiens pallens]|uniref:trypsin-1-like n=1 Tax=Culex pipiens pallens TaxID=42434 RepID=UPI0019536519|nr:trypsin-1-like [Culex pipiens pallens]